MVITLDVDWAPDCAIDFVAQALVSRGIRATWYVTHQSPAIRRLRQYPDLFELGIHPNFLQGSTHGDSPEAVLRHCLELVPDAHSVRMHALVQSSPLLRQILLSTPIQTDASLFLPGARGLRPVEYHAAGGTLLRVPFVWEDDFELERGNAGWGSVEQLVAGEGLRVFNFHPAHIYLNSTTLEPYQLAKRRKPCLAQMTDIEMTPYVQDGNGIQSLFLALLDLVGRSGPSMTIRDIHADWSGGGRAARDAKSPGTAMAQEARPSFNGRERSRRG